MATFTRMPRTLSLGTPHDKVQQQRILLAMLGLLAQDAPVEPALLEEEELDWRRLR